MFDIINATDGSKIATVDDYEAIDDALRAEMLRIRATVGRYESTAYERIELYTGDVRLRYGRINRKGWEWL
jgi:hypothetical protein